VTGRLRVTYVHNWFDGTGQRHPRVRSPVPCSYTPQASDTVKATVTAGAGVGKM
jgi:pectate lyase